MTHRPQRLTQNPQFLHFLKRHPETHWEEGKCTFLIIYQITDGNTEILICYLITAFPFSSIKRIWRSGRHRLSFPTTRFRTYKDTAAPVSVPGCHQGCLEGVRRGGVGAPRVLWTQISPCTGERRGNLASLKDGNLLTSVVPRPARLSKWPLCKTATPESDRAFNWAPFVTK